MAVEEILIDLGTSTVKVYKRTKDGVEHLFSRTIYFKEGFDPEKGISERAWGELRGVIEEIRKKYPKSRVKLFATALFRKMTTRAQENFIGRIQKETGAEMKIVSHEDENRYLFLALAGKYKGDRPILLINIGGGSTELVVVINGKQVEKHNIDLGVGTVLTEFKSINDAVSGVSLSEVCEFVSSKLPELENTLEVAIYSGGELTYMQRGGYQLEKNTFFQDVDHPLLITRNNFSVRNKEVFETVTYAQLEAMMPENPKWVIGSRACSAVALAIVNKYGIESIIPSDSNMINGIVRSE